MVAGQLADVLLHLHKVAPQRNAAKLPDGELLALFVAKRDEAAFQALIDRHGAMVLSVCRRVLGDPHAAADAFQATFLVLASKAASLRKHELVGNWLYGVASRVASKAKSAAARRRGRELAAPTRTTTDPLDEITARELLQALDEELARLPGDNRAALIACYLEGKTRDEAAQHLGWSLATLKRRLHAGRDLLRTRLTRRGLELGTILLSVVVEQRTASAALPSSLETGLARAATLAMAGKAIPPNIVATPIVAFAESVLVVAPSRRARAAVLALLVAGLAGVGVVVHQTRATQAQEKQDNGTSVPATQQTDKTQSGKPDGNADGLEGTWKVLSVQSGGKEMVSGPDAPLKTKNPRVRFAKSELIFLDDLRDDNSWGTYHVDGKPTPKTIDLLRKEDGGKLLGIYALDGDKLQLCLAEPGEARPTELASPAGSKTMFVSLQKQPTTVATATTKPTDVEKKPEDLKRLIQQAQAQLLGRWERVSGGDAALVKGDDGDAVKRPPTQIANELVFEAERFAFKFPNTDTEIAYSFTLDPSQKPKAIDFIYLGPTPGGRKSPAIRGIWEIDGDTLKLCYSVDPAVKRATEFKEEPGLARELLILKRAAAKDK